MDSIPKLPPPLLHNILDFVIPGFGDEDLDPYKRQSSTLALKTLRLVSKAWAKPFHDIVQEYQRSLFTLKLTTASDTELEKIYRRVEEIGEYVTNLHISVSGVANNARPRHSTITIRQGQVEEISINWARIFAGLPRVKRLNLATVRLDSPHLVTVLDAAATHFPSLESLELPCQVHEVDENIIQVLLQTLYRALQKWRVEGNCGGLRHLTVPTRYSEKRFEDNKIFFENVAVNCPQVEYLDGYKKCMALTNRLECTDVWLLTLKHWERFNATCTNLREFHWVVVPFGDPYFRAFGEHIKSHLKKLSFAVCMDWNWRWYFHDKSLAAGKFPDVEWEGSDYCERPGYGFLATDVNAALKGCPWLDELEVLLYHPGDSDDFVANDFPDHDMINHDVFDDRFCQALASYCPYLSKFSIEEVAEEHNTQTMTPIRTLTDKGLKALAQLTFLQSLELKSIHCTGKGILGFLNELSVEFTGNRVFVIRIGGSSGTTKMAFYDAVNDLLVQLVQATDAPCTHQKFVLRIENCSYSSRNLVDSGWSRVYLNNLKQLMDKVKGVHPSLRQHVVTMGGDAYTFKRIAEFGLYSAHANPDIYCGWEDWENEQNNDGVTIVDRSMCKQLNYRSDESEYYSHNWTEFFYDDIDGYYSDEYDDLAYRYGGLGF